MEEGDESNSNKEPVAQHALIKADKVRVVLGSQGLLSSLVATTARERRARHPSWLSGTPPSPPSLAPGPLYLVPRKSLPSRSC